MTKEVATAYYNDMSDNDKNKLYEKARQLISDRIKNDDKFLEDFYNTLSKFTSVDKMIEAMIEDAVNNNIEVEELPQYSEEWLSWIMRL